MESNKELSERTKREMEYGANLITWNQFKEGKLVSYKWHGDKHYKVTVTTHTGERMDFIESRDCFPSAELIAKIALVALQV